MLQAQTSEYSGPVYMSRRPTASRLERHPRAEAKRARWDTDAPDYPAPRGPIRHRVRSPVLARRANAGTTGDGDHLKRRFHPVADHPSPQSLASPTSARAPYWHAENHWTLVPARRTRLVLHQRPPLLLADVLMLRIRKHPYVKSGSGRIAPGV